MARIENNQRRMVSFSKRRKGLFKEAQDLSSFTQELAPLFLSFLKPTVPLSSDCRPSTLSSRNSSLIQRKTSKKRLLQHWRMIRRLGSSSFGSFVEKFLSDSEENIGKKQSQPCSAVANDKVSLSLQWWHMRHLIMKALLPLAIVLVIVMNMRLIEASRVLNEDHAYRLLLSTMQKGSDTPSAPNFPDSPWSTMQKGSDTPSAPNLPDSPWSTMQKGSDTPSSPNLPPFIPLSKGSGTPSAPNVPISPVSSIPNHFTGHATPPPRP